MTSELRVNTLKDASGGNSIGLSYVANGSAKAWANFDGAVTTSAEDTTGKRDVFNIGSLVDGGTGHTTINFTAGFANTGYVVTNLTEYSIDATLNSIRISIISMSQTALEIKTHWNTTVYDTDYVGVTVHGELA